MARRRSIRSHMAARRLILTRPKLASVIRILIAANITANITHMTPPSTRSEIHTIGYQRAMTKIRV